MLDERSAEDFSERLEEVYERAYNFANKLVGYDGTAEDLLHDAILKALRKYGSLRNKAKFKSWLFQIIMNTFRNQLKRKRLKRIDLVENLDVLSTRVPQGPDLHERTSSRFLVRKCFNRLPGPQKEAILLFEVEGYPLKEIARLQGVPVPTVKSRLSQGRKRLRRYYFDETGEEEIGALGTLVDKKNSHEEKAPSGTEDRGAL
jgi:RNA polymerase sigma-70 factor (ECF subfamily)